MAQGGRESEATKLSFFGECAKRSLIEIDYLETV
jgi:hypothetical protein